MKVVHAIPRRLQVFDDRAIGGGYDDGSIVSYLKEFTLVAYGGGDDLTTLDTSDTYYISIAIDPKVGPDPVNFGSFEFGGITYNMGNVNTYGTPEGLPAHGIFSTLYTEVAFTFNPLNLS